MITKFPEAKVHVGPAAESGHSLIPTSGGACRRCNKSQGLLLRVARDGLYDVQVAPGVLYETLRLKDVSLRAILVRLITNSRFHRLMPEAYSESMEILREIERLRPDWLREAPDLQFFNRLVKDWTRTAGGFWVRCARSPESEASFLYQSEVGMIEGAEIQARHARKDMIASGWKRNPPMDKTLAGFPHPVPGWRGEMVEAWRMDSLTGLTYGLARKGNPYRDWIAPFVELDDGLLDSAAWVEFWLHLTDCGAHSQGNGCDGPMQLRAAFSKGNTRFTRRFAAFHVFCRIGCRNYGR